MIDLRTIAVDELRRGMAESEEAKAHVTSWMLALASGLIVEAYGVDAAQAMLRREADALPEEYHSDNLPEIH